MNSPVPELPPYSRKKPMPFRFGSHHHPDCGTKLAPLTEETPVQLKAPLASGLPPLGALTKALPETSPFPGGVHETLTEQLPPADRLVPQLLVALKPLLADAVAIAMGDGLLLVTVIVCAALATPICAEPKFKAPGDSTI